MLDRVAGENAGELRLGQLKWWVLGSGEVQEHARNCTVVLGLRLPQRVGCDLEVPQAPLGGIGIEDGAQLLCREVVALQAVAPDEELRCLPGLCLQTRGTPASLLQGVHPLRRDREALLAQRFGR